MKKLMLIGKTGSGKTTLYQRLASRNLKYEKTQAIEFHNHIIDTPGEYLENRRYYSALQVTSTGADVVALVLDCKDKSSSYPPGFASMFNKPTVGIISKIDLIGNDDDYHRAEKSLRLSGIDQIFKISSLNNQGVENLIKFLQSVE
ncbi:EutP/PduV family microcompartment system protein [Alkalibaculum sp. M08DMB]|uniref:EutP/PduV family microcompartment system protein n=2 Tax=Alkalibaculum sporogenes TaxID=2655001 RepID=A0A6A7K7W8_9FIRM|nr:EutP/PduV family microcompartment system protein [Alkalibaculum sporogenes]